MTDFEVEQALSRCLFRTTPEFDAKILAQPPGGIAGQPVLSGDDAGEDDAGEFENQPQIAIAGEAPRSSPYRARAATVWRWRRRAVVSCLFAVAGSAGMLIWLARPDETWAQVQQAVRDREWVRCQHVADDGTTDLDAWISDIRGICATREADSAVFEDLRLKVRYEFDRKGQSIKRSISRDGTFGKLIDWRRFFERAFHGDEADFPVGHFELVERARRPIVHDRRTWSGYEFVVRNRFWPEGQTARLKFLVDPVTHLPHFVVLEDEHHNDPPVIHLSLTYPEKGPIDIYDLGAPREARLIDLVPTDEVR